MARISFPCGLRPRICARLAREALRSARLLGAVLVTIASMSAFGDTASALPVQGTFDACPLGALPRECAQRLAVMRAGGLQVVVMAAWGNTPAALADYADAAHRVGMSVMWWIGYPYVWQRPGDESLMASAWPQFAAACGCSDNRELLRYVVRFLGGQPGTYGYYAADDTGLSGSDQRGIPDYVATIKQSDAIHPVLLAASGSQQQNQYQAIPDMMGLELYPVTTQHLLPIDSFTKQWSGVDAAARDSQSSAERAGKKSAFILQAFTYGDSVGDGEAASVCSLSDTTWSCYARLRYPNPAEQLALRDAVLTNANPQLILWYSFPQTYGSLVTQDGVVFPTGLEAASRWAGLTAAIEAPCTPCAHERPHGRMGSHRHRRSPQAQPASACRARVHRPTRGRRARRCARSIRSKRPNGDETLGRHYASGFERWYSITSRIVSSNVRPALQPVRRSIFEVSGTRRGMSSKPSP